jgi:hypothetical protein
MSTLLREGSLGSLQQTSLDIYDDGGIPPIHEQKAS